MDRRLSVMRICRLHVPIRHPCETRVSPIRPIGPPRTRICSDAPLNQIPRSHIVPCRTLYMYQKPPPWIRIVGPLGTVTGQTLPARRPLQLQAAISIGVTSARIPVYQYSHAGRSHNIGKRGPSILSRLNQQGRLRFSRPVTVVSLSGRRQRTRNRMNDGSRMNEHAQGRCGTLTI